MAAFEYQAIDSRGKTQKGLIEADTARQARQQLRGMSLMPIEVGEVTSRESSGGSRKKRDKLNVQTLSLITRQLATLISAGQRDAVSTTYVSSSSTDRGWLAASSTAMPT